MWAYSSSNFRFPQMFLLVGFQAWETACLDRCTHSFCPHTSRAAILSLLFISLDPNTSVRSSGREGNRKPPLSQTKGPLSQDAACLPSTAGHKQMGSVGAKPGHRDPSPVIPLCPPEVPQTACLSQAAKSSASCHSHSRQTLNKSPPLFTVLFVHYSSSMLLLLENLLLIFGDMICSLS